MDKFLERHKLLKPLQEEIGNWEVLYLLKKKNEFIVISFPIKKISSPNSSLDNSIKYLIESLSESWGGGNTSKLILQGHYYSDTQIRQTQEKKKYRSISPMNINERNLNKIFTNQIQQDIKIIIHHDQVTFILWMQGSFNIQKINVSHRINRPKE